MSDEQGIEAFAYSVQCKLHARRVDPAEGSDSHRGNPCAPRDETDHTTLAPYEGQAPQGEGNVPQSCNNLGRRVVCESLKELEKSRGHRQPGASKGHESCDRIVTRCRR